MSKSNFGTLKALQNQQLVRNKSMQDAQNAKAEQELTEYLNEIYFFAEDAAAHIVQYEANQEGESIMVADRIIELTKNITDFILEHSNSIELSYLVEARFQRMRSLVYKFPMIDCTILCKEIEKKRNDQQRS